MNGYATLGAGRTAWQADCRTVGNDPLTPGRYCAVHEGWNCLPPTSAATDCPTCHGNGWVEP